MAKSRAEKHIFPTPSAAWERLGQIFPTAKKQSLSQSSVFVRQMEITRWQCCFYTKCTFVERKRWVVACECIWVCVCVWTGTGEKLTLCVRTVNYSVKVLGHEELIGIPKLTMLVMSEGEKQRCTLWHTGLSNLCAVLGFVRGSLTVGWLAPVYFMINYFVWKKIGLFYYFIFYTFIFQTLSNFVWQYDIQYPATPL